HDALSISFQIVLKQSHKLIRFMFQFAMFCFILKIGLQTLSLIPDISNTAFQHRNLVIGFIHLTMLGVISGFLFAYILQTKLVKLNKTLNIGMYVFVLGFRSEEHTSELQSRENLVCRLLLEKKIITTV